MTDIIETYESYQSRMTSSGAPSATTSKTTPRGHSSSHVVVNSRSNASNNGYAVVINTQVNISFRRTSSMCSASSSSSASANAQSSVVTSSCHNNNNGNLDMSDLLRCRLSPPPAVTVMSSSATTASANANVAMLAPLRSELTSTSSSQSVSCLRSVRSARKRAIAFVASKMLLLQTVLALAVLCLPGNIVTLIIKDDLDRMAAQWNNESSSALNRAPRGTTRPNPMLANATVAYPDDYAACSSEDYTASAHTLESSAVVVKFSMINDTADGNGTQNDNNRSTETKSHSPEKSMQIAKTTKWYRDMLSDFCEPQKQTTGHTDSVLFINCMLADAPSDGSGNNGTGQARFSKEAIAESICKGIRQSKASSRSENKTGNSAPPSSSSSTNGPIPTDAMFAKLLQCIMRIHKEPKQRARAPSSNSAPPSASSAVPNNNSNNNVTFHCHEDLASYTWVVLVSKFWLDGVLLSVTAVGGLIGNALTFVVLHRQESTSNFNKLLMSLALVDSLLIVSFVLNEAVVGTFTCAPYWYKIAFPYFLYPTKAIVQSCSIFMVVAISAERYKAICYPLRHRPSPWHYIAVVVVAAAAQNVRKFFEFSLVTTRYGSPDYWITDIMEHETYIIFNGWWDELITTGLAPFVGLVFFNLRIYCKIRASANYRYRFVGNSTFRRGRGGLVSATLANSSSSTTSQVQQQQHQQQHQQQQQTGVLLQQHQHFHRSMTSSATTTSSFVSALSRRNTSSCSRRSSPEMRAAAAVNPRAEVAAAEASEAVSVPTRQQHRASLSAETETSLVKLCSCPLCASRRWSDAEDAEDAQCCGCLGPRHPRRSRHCSSCMRKHHFDVESPRRHQEDLSGWCCGAGTASDEAFEAAGCRPSIEMDETSGDSVVMAGGAGLNQGVARVYGRKGCCLANIANDCRLGSGLDDVEEMLEKRIDVFPSAVALPPWANSTLNRRTLHRYASGQLHIRRRREKSTLILISIVMIFIGCHFFRLSLQLYIVTHPSHMTADHHSFCMLQGKFHVPAALYIMLSASNLLLVFNSSVNFVVYCLVEQTFRQELVGLLRDLAYFCFVGWALRLRDALAFRRRSQSSAATADMADVIVTVSATAREDLQF